MFGGPRSAGWASGANGTIGIMKVLVVGAGGREHALCRALAASPRVEALICAPGNGGIARAHRCEPVAADDIEGLSALAAREGVDLVVVGPELPLVGGLADRLRAEGVAVLGPDAAAARLEGSKAFTKAFCARHRIPTAAFRVFGSTEADAARAYLRTHGAPVVVKADGLAAGKGVVVAADVDEALAALDACFAGDFGAAGGQVVIEDCLIGREASLFALVDGTDVVELGSAQDHKRAFEGDRGPNTGGMGAIAPAPLLDDAMRARVMDEIVRPTAAGMLACGHAYRGVLYAGLMLTTDGPKLIEYNVRFGDPECQAVLPLLASDLADLFAAAAAGRLGDLRPSWHDGHAVTVVLAARGYPGTYAGGSEIRGLENAEAIEGVTICHAGTRIEDGRVFAAGGRVLNVTAIGRSVAEARARAYAAVDLVDWPEGFCRRDIGASAAGQSEP